MRKRYITPQTLFVFTCAPALLAGSASKTNGETLNPSGHRTNGNAGNAASRGGSLWDDED